MLEEECKGLDLPLTLIPASSLYAQFPGDIRRGLAHAANTAASLSRPSNTSTPEDGSVANTVTVLAITDVEILAPATTSGGKRTEMSREDILTEFGLLSLVRLTETGDPALLLLLLTTNPASVSPRVYSDVDLHLHILPRSSQSRVRLLRSLADGYEEDDDDDDDDEDDGVSDKALKDATRGFVHDDVVRGVRKARLSRSTRLLTALRSTTPLSVFTAPVVTPDVTFEDVGGQEAAKTVLQDAVERALSDGERPVRGVLLEGPPGTGKTMLAKATASALGASFLAVPMSRILVGVLGGSEAALGQLFEVARGAAPCLVFFDEMQALFGVRGGASSSSSDNNLTTTLLEEMANSAPLGVVVLGATNVLSGIDPGLLRPGRFDTVVTVSLPPFEDRAVILERALSSVVFDSGATGGVRDDPAFTSVVEAMEGFSGADVVGLVRRAGLFAVAQGAGAITYAHIADALESVFDQ